PLARALGAIYGCNLRASRYNSAALICRARYGDPVGPLAMIRREPGQARKGAAAAVISCAGVWLAGLPPMAPSASSSIFVFLSSCLLVFLSSSPLRVEALLSFVRR